MMLKPIKALDIAVFLWLVLMLASFLWLTGCGSDTARQTKTAERLTTVTGPIVVDTPIGQFTAQPIKHEMVRSQEEQEQTQTRIVAPDVGAVMAPLVAASPIGPAVGILGVVTALATGWKAVSAMRQRDQVIKSVEHARKALPEDLDEKFTSKLAEKQDEATQKIVQQVTA